MTMLSFESYLDTEEMILIAFKAYIHSQIILKWELWLCICPFLLTIQFITFISAIDQMNVIQFVCCPLLKYFLSGRKHKS